MPCRFDEKILHLYIDNELGEQIRERLEKHLESCEACRLKLDTLLTLRSELSAACQKARAPVYLKENIISGLNAFKQTKFSYAGFLESLKTAFLNMRARRLLAAGFVLAIAGLLIVNSGYNTLNSLAEDLVEGYSSWPGANPTDIINTSDVYEAAAYLERSFGLEAELPEFLPDSLVLVSAGAMYGSGQKIAHIRYRNGENRYSLYIVRGSLIDHNGVDCFKSHGRDFEITSRSDVNLLSWQEGDYYYILCGCCCFDRLAGLASSTI